MAAQDQIVAIRGERGSYNAARANSAAIVIVAIRGERGSYNDARSERVNDIETPECINLVSMDGRL
jgi:hypothetical protein